MNITALVNLVSENTEQTKQETEATLKEAFNIIRGCVASGEAVRLSDFGTFEARWAADRVDPVIPIS